MTLTVCDACSLTYETGKRFCRMCGAPLRADDARVPQAVCRRCGLLFAEAGRPCPGCKQMPGPVNGAGGGLLPEVAIPAQPQGSLEAASLCETCRLLFSPARRFCRICGSALTPTAADLLPAAICEECALVYADAVSTCVGCGKGLASEPADAPLRVAPQLLLCKRCGLVSEAGKRFCRACGDPLAQSLAEVDTHKCDRCGARFAASCGACPACFPPAPAEPAAEATPVQLPLPRPSEIAPEQPKLPLATEKIAVVAREDVSIKEPSVPDRMPVQAPLTPTAPTLVTISPPEPVEVQALPTSSPIPAPVAIGSPQGIELQTPRRVTLEPAKKSRVNWKPVTAIAGVILVLITGTVLVKRWMEAPSAPKSSALSPAAEAHNARGVELAEAGDLDGAITEFKQAVAADPGNFKAHNNLGVLYKRKGLIVQAISEYRTASEVEPSNPVPYKNLAILYEEQLTHAEALRHYQRYLELAPTAGDAALIRAKVQDLQDRARGATSRGGASK